MGLTRPTLSLRCRGPTFGVALTSTAHRLGRRCRNMRSPSEKYEYDSPLFTPSTARSASIVTPDSLVLSLWKLWRAYLSSVRATAPNLPTAQPVRPSGARRMEFHCGQMMRQPTVAVLHTVECVSAKLRVTASCPATPATNTTSLPPASRARFQVGVTGHMSARRASLVQLGPYGSPSHPSPVNNLRSDANPDSMCLLMLAQVSGWLEGRWSVLRRLSLTMSPAVSPSLTPTPTEGGEHFCGAFTGETAPSTAVRAPQRCPQSTPHACARVEDMWAPLRRHTGTRVAVRAHTGSLAPG